MHVIGEKFLIERIEFCDWLLKKEELRYIRCLGMALLQVWIEVYEST